MVRLTSDEWLAYADHLEEKELGRHLMLCHSDDAQPYAVEAGYARYREELFPELADSPLELYSQEFVRETAQNRLLLQLDVDHNGMRFGRGGPLFIGIRDIDLAARDFSHVWYMAQ